MAADGLFSELKCPVPKGGFADGLDPALDDEGYPAAFSPDMENIRVGFGRWETRLGMSLFKAMGGSGDVRMLTTMNKADGTRIRLLARGTGAAAQLYDYQVGTDTSFQSCSGGGSLGGTSAPYFQGVTLNDYFYFTDRAGALKRYTPSRSGTQVAGVTQPAAPAAAPGAKPRFYQYLYSFRDTTGAFAKQLTETDNSKYAMSDATSTFPNPLGSNTVKLEIKTTSAAGQGFEESASKSLASDTIAWFYQQTRNRFQQQFDLGFSGYGDLGQAEQNRAPSATEWYPNFLPIGGLSSLTYFRWLCVNATVGSDYISAMVLPGRLSGQYRWRYTHYNSSTGQESAPSPQTNGGAPLDFTAQGKADDRATTAAFRKSCGLTVVSDSGTDATTDQMRIYRNGGTPKLTVDSRGRETWFLVGTINDAHTDLNGAASKNQINLTVDSTTGFTVGDFICVNKSGSTEEYGFVTAKTSTVLTVKDALLYDHSDEETVEVAFIDNVPNDQIDITHRIQLERDNPPSAAQWIARSPDGRLWFFNYLNTPTGIAVSNRATPDRPTDYEVCPDAVDPQTRGDLLQGWRFQIGGDTTDEQIVWGGFFDRVATVLTRRHLYQIMAYSQADWGPSAVRKVLDVGCIAGDTVQEVNGVLYWCADGPRVMRWDGRSAPECISHERINNRLANAPSAYWSQWLAVYHAKLSGKYYCLYNTPQGATTNTDRLDFNSENGAWEPVAYYDATGAKLAWRGATVLDGGADAMELYQAATDGNVYQAETGSLDNAVPIKIRFATKKFYLQGWLGMVHTLLLRLAAVTDTVTLSVLTGGSEYGDITRTYSLSLSGSGDNEVYRRLHRTLLGRWVQVKISGDVSNRPAFRDLIVRWMPWRSSHYKRH